MTDDPEPDDELDAIVAQLEEAGLVETYTGADGRVAYRLTSEGTRVGRSLALAGDDAVLDALLDDG